MTTIETPRGTCAVHPTGDRACYVCQQPDGQRPCDFGGSYCPTCARPRGNDGHPDECVCAGTDAKLVKPVHVPGGQRAALDSLAAWARTAQASASRSVVLVADRAWMQRRTRMPAGPKVPATITVEVTDSGWRVTASTEPAEGGLFDDDALRPVLFQAVLRACFCGRPGCTRRNCADREHHHRRAGYGGEYHAADVEAFVREVAKTLPGRVAIPAVPRLAEAAPDQAYTQTQAAAL